MKLPEIQSRIQSWLGQGRTMFATSSFQTHSLPMLHIISRIDPSIPVMFLNTGYLFPETLAFRDQVARLMNLNVVNIAPTVPKFNQRDDTGRLYFASNPDLCCYLNKVLPLEPCLQKFDIWINGIRSDQNSNRQSMGVIQQGPFDCLRFHPMLDWTVAMIYDYLEQHELPRHPLDEQGYWSIGCEPCTIAPGTAGHRSGRWHGQNKTECGLHTQLARKQS